MDVKDKLKGAVEGVKDTFSGAIDKVEEMVGFGKKEGSSFEKAHPVEVEKYLQYLTYPASKEELLSHAEDNGAPSLVIKTLECLEEEHYNSPVEVTQAISRL